MTLAVTNKRWDEDRLLSVRSEVLAMRPTGARVDLDEAVDYQRSLPKHKIGAHVVAAAHAKGEVLAQPRHGATLLDEQVAAMVALQEAGADIVSVLTDAYTRQLRFDDAERALQESRVAGRSLVCGYPVASMGVRETRRIVEAVDRPCSVRMASQDSRLCKEIYLAAGFTYMFMGPAQNLAYEKDAPMALLIEHYQYEDRLAAYYHEQGAPIIKELPGTLTGTLVPPCIMLACTIIDALLSIEQGIKNVIVSCAMLGNLVQDVAALRVLRKLTQEYAARLGYSDVNMYTVAPQWMGDFPQEPSQAYAIICQSTAHAALAPADITITKSLDEAYGVPTGEANAAGVKATKQTLRLLRGQTMGPSAELGAEMAMTETETRAILERTLDLGNGDWAVGLTRALTAGVIDVPFSPSKWNAGKVMPARDLTGAVRLLRPGNLPLPRDVLEFHEEKMRERADREGREAGYQMLIDDVLGYSKPLVGEDFN